MSNSKDNLPIIDRESKSVRGVCEKYYLGQIFTLVGVLVLLALLVVPCVFAIIHLVSKEKSVISESTVCVITNRTIVNECTHYLLDINCSTFSGEVDLTGEYCNMYAPGQYIEVSYVDCPSSSCRISPNKIKNNPEGYLNKDIFTLCLVLWILSWVCAIWIGVHVYACIAGGN